MNFLHPTESGKTPETSNVRETLHARTRELALRAGRIPPHVSQLDYEQAKREVTGEFDLDRQDAVLAAMEATAARGRGPEWTDTELDESILILCDEFPDARMSACSRALEHCRRSTPHGTRGSLLAAMRDTLRLDMESQQDGFRAAA
jgi:hypothetical protein